MHKVDYLIKGNEKMILVQNQEKIADRKRIKQYVQYLKKEKKE